MYVSMKDMLLHAHHNNYAVMAINCVNMEQVKAVIESAKGQFLLQAAYSRKSIGRFCCLYSS